jgi:hypothetical protein
MKTLGLCILLIVSGSFVWKVSLTMLNIAGLPGALVAWNANKRESVAGALRFFAGVLISLIGQSYVYLAWIALVVSFTKQTVHDGGVLVPVIWPVAFIASFFPIYFCAAAGTGEAEVGYSEWNPQVYAIAFAQVVAIIGLFIFIFFPNVILVGWPWITYLFHWWLG